MGDYGLEIDGDYDDADFCRGYGAQTNEDFDEDFQPGDGSHARFEDEEVNNKAPEMPQNFYQEVESFLTREPPKLKEPKKIKSLKKDGVAKGLVLPDIYAKNNDVSPPQPPQATSKVRSKLLSNTNKPTNQRQFDHNLLREAFAYTDKLLKEALIEEANSSLENDGGDGEYQNLPPRAQGKKAGAAKGPSRTAPIEAVYVTPHPSSAPASKKKGDSSVYQTSAGGSKGVVKKLRAKVPSESSLQAPNHDAAFNIGNDSGDVGRRNPINFEELVSNFEGGVTLQKLRKELEESKQSMKQSENFMRQLSQEYFGKGKGKGKQY
jgi:hypothetical protein